MNLPLEGISRLLPATFPASVWCTSPWGVHRTAVLICSCIYDGHGGMGVGGMPHRPGGPLVSAPSARKSCISPEWVVYYYYYILNGLGILDVLFILLLHLLWSVEPEMSWPPLGNGPGLRGCLSVCWGVFVFVFVLSLLSIHSDILTSVFSTFISIEGLWILLEQTWENVKWLRQSTNKSQLFFFSFPPLFFIFFLGGFSFTFCINQKFSNCGKICVT